MRFHAPGSTEAKVLEARAGHGAGSDLVCGPSPTARGPWTNIGVEAGQLQSEGEWARRGCRGCGRRTASVCVPAPGGRRLAAPARRPRVKRSVARHGYAASAVSLMSDEVEPWCRKRGFRADDLRRDVGEKGEDVVAGLALDLVDVLHVWASAAALLPDARGGGSRNHAQLAAMASAAWAADLERGREARLRRRISASFRAGVAGDRPGAGCSRSAARERRPRRL